MRRITRTSRWRLIFPNIGERGRLFFYSGAKRNGFASFFHRHNGNDRPHLHLIEFSEPAPDLSHEQGGEHREKGRQSHRHDLLKHGPRKETEPTGHWHFTFAEAPDLSSASALCFPQVLTLDWIIISSGSEDRATSLDIAPDHWARPPP
jgi:hypothetical protein